MAPDDDPSGQGILLLPARHRALPSVGVVLACGAVLVLVVVLVLSLPALPGFVGALVTLGGVVLALVAVAVAGYHLARLASWARQRRRPGPALWLTPEGLAYSAAYTGSFPVRLRWSDVRGSAYRSGFWCVDVVPSAVAAVLPPAVWVPPVGPEQAVDAAEQLVRSVPEAGRVEAGLLVHLLAFGTPVALDLRRTAGAPSEEAERRLGRWSGGRCSFRPVTGADDPGLVG
jgi:hypothetical protein